MLAKKAANGIKNATRHHNVRNSPFNGRARFNFVTTPCLQKRCHEWRFLIPLLGKLWMIAFRSFALHWLTDCQRYDSQWRFQIPTAVVQVCTVCADSGDAVYLSWEPAWTVNRSIFPWGRGAPKKNQCGWYLNFCLLNWHDTIDSILHVFTKVVWSCCLNICSPCLNNV